MRIVLLGGGGFIGRHLAAALSARGHHVVIATRHREAVKNDLILLPNTDVIACDYNQAQTLHPILEGADAVVNLIGILNETDKGEFERVHCELTRVLVAGALARKVKRFIQISALGASASAPSAYLCSKAKAEQALKDIIGMRSVIMRPSVVFGSGDSFVMFFAKLARRLPFMFLPCADSLMQPIAVEDMVRLLVNALENGDSDGKTLSLGGPDVLPLSDIVAKITYACGYPRRIIGLGRRMSYMAATLADYQPFDLPFSRDNCLSASVANACSADGNDAARLLNDLSSLESGLAKLFVRQDSWGDLRARR